MQTCIAPTVSREAPASYVKPCRPTYLWPRWMTRTRSVAEVIMVSTSLAGRLRARPAARFSHPGRLRGYRACARSTFRNRISLPSYCGVFTMKRPSLRSSLYLVAVGVTVAALTMPSAAQSAITIRVTSRRRTGHQLSVLLGPVDGVGHSRQRRVPCLLHRRRRRTAHHLHGTAVGPRMPMGRAGFVRHLAVRGSPQQQRRADCLGPVRTVPGG